MLSYRLLWFAHASCIPQLFWGLVSSLRKTAHRFDYDSFYRWSLVMDEKKGKTGI